MDDDLHILKEETRSRIASMLGRAEELTMAAKHEQKLLDALCRMEDKLDGYIRKYEGNTTSLCPYICLEGLAATGIWQPQQFEDKLREACSLDGKALAAFLRENEKRGYLNFHGDSKSKILDTLREHFPTMRKYGYTNFSTYF